MGQLDAANNAPSQSRAAPHNAAMFVAMLRPLPATVTLGQQCEVAITMRNSGATTWRYAGRNPHRLGSQSPPDNTSWGLARVDVPHDVVPGEEVTFTFTVVAPSAPGEQPFQWRMVQEDIGWFGDATPEAIIKVARQPDPQPSSGLPGISTTPI
jgi:hypothetical protein